MVKIKLPKRLNIISIDEIIPYLLDKKLNPSHKEVKYDCSALDWIDPIGMTVFFNLVKKLQSLNVKQSITGLTNSHRDPLKFMDDSNFFKEILGEALREDACPRDTTIPIRMVEHKESYYWVENSCINWIAKRINRSPESLAELKLCLYELFNNIKDHSSVNSGCIFTQYYPRKDTVSIALADFGVGIPHKVRTVCPNMKNDAEAIKKAMEEGFTTKSSHRNRGVGLHLLAQTVANNEGTLTIRSGYGKILHYKDGTSPFQMEQHYPGTAFLIELSTSKFDNSLTFEEDFEW